jgi:hypothetical protein
MASYGRASLWASNVAKGQYKYNPMISITYPWAGYAGKVSATSLTNGAGLPFSEALKWDGSISLKNNEYSISMQDIGQGTLSSGGAQSFRFIVDAQTKENPIYLNNPDLSSVPYATHSVYNGTSVYFKTGPNKISYTPKTVDATSTPGTIVHIQAGIADVGSTSNTFQFSPSNSAGTQLKFNITNSNSASYTTTNGTSSSTSSTTGTSFSTTDAVTASVGIKSASASASSSVTQAWSNSWTNIEEVNFSSSKDSKATNESSALSSIQPEATVENSDGTYGFNTVTNQPGGGSVTTTTGFVPGVWYKASITKTVSTIQNNLSGTYAIGGSMGYLQDDIYTGLTTNGDGGGTYNLGGGSVSPSVADAIYAAARANYTQAAGINIDGLNFISPTPSPNLQIDFNGTAAGVSTINNNFTITYHEIQAPSTNSARSFRGSSTDSNYTNLSDFDTTSKDALGVHHEFDGDSKGKKTIVGSGHPDVVYGSKKSRHHFSKFTNSHLYGNKKADKFEFGKLSSGNSIHAFGGNDHVKSSSSQTASMGEGNDIYTINSNAKSKSLHRIKLGGGEDTVIVDSANAQFTIADFHPFMDTVKFGSSMDEDLLSAKLVPFEKGKKILDNAKIQFSYNDSPIGVAYLSSDTDFIQELVDPVTHQSMLILNSAEFKNKHFNNDFSAYKQFANAVKTGVAYSKPLAPNDWETMDNNQRSVIMSDAFSLGGVDFSERDALDILSNHINPSDFHQVMFG